MRDYELQVNGPLYIKDKDGRMINVTGLRDGVKDCGIMFGNTGKGVFIAPREEWVELKRKLIISKL